MTASSPADALPQSAPTREPGPVPTGTRLPRSQRRTQLLAAAQEVFVAQGYHAAAMDDIAERAGVSKPVLYQHFPGKLELYLALLDASADSLLGAVRSALTSTTDNSERVAATVRAYFTFVAEPGGAFRLVFESDLTSEPAVRDRVDQVNQACAHLVSDVIREDTGLSPDLAMLLAVGLTGSSQVAARWWLTRDGSIPQSAAEQLVSTLAWRGISRFPRAGE